ncbi:hypothetical protein ACE1B6_21855 [Aerosakkonemataceae cyanobacterium BLCC-F154]|uniref:DUF2281 domain-containing protein n=1 Tax=Floridaenema fluviatile BLCC-F154 TaxID=3153640 RepID=A0ABV4YGL8_9CYAN
MTAKDLILQEVENMPDFLLDEVLDFLQFIKAKYQQEKLETTILSESSLQKDWLRPEEDRAWQNL